MPQPDRPFINWWIIIINLSGRSGPTQLNSTQIRLHPSADSFSILELNNNKSHRYNSFNPIIIQTQNREACLCYVVGPYIQSQLATSKVLALQFCLRHSLVSGLLGGSRGPSRWGYLRLVAQSGREDPREDDGGLSWKTTAVRQYFVNLMIKYL